MLVDLPEAPPELLEAGYDACICGAGVAGITVALRLAARGLRVLLLEGGGLAYSEQSQELYRAGSTGLRCYPESSRLRFLGGTSNHWAGRCRPFRSNDFERREIAGMPGWPIAKAEIDRYLAEAESILDLAPGAYASKPAPELDPEVFAPDAAAISAPTRFGTKYLEALRAEPRITLVLNANVTQLELDDSRSRVARVRLKTFGGAERSARARCVVLAMGAIENARLLLASNRQVGTGIGNHSDLVGRCFMEHFNVQLGGFVLADRYASFDRQFEYYTAPAMVRDKGIGSANLTLHYGRGYVFWGRTAKLKAVLARAACEAGLNEPLRLLFDYSCPGEGVIRTLIEQSPNRASRVSLLEERDALGMPKANVNWEMNDFDRHTIRTAAMMLAQEFARHEIGRVQLSDYIVDPDAEIPSYHHSHHMGTTRMAADPRHGVVSPDCQVFGVDDLYVAGSSIFATGGGGNPTLPIVQFALRLVDTLAARLGADASPQGTSG